MDPFSLLILMTMNRTYLIMVVIMDMAKNATCKQTLVTFESGALSLQCSLE